MDIKNLIINAVLAGFWAGLALLSSGDYSKAALFAAGAVAVRTAVGYVADKIGVTIVVDKPSP